MNVDLRHLRYFVTVAEELSFTGAARRLGVAQQVVSRHVAELERRCGSPLLERTTRSVRLTDAGHVFRSEAAAVVAAFDAAIQRIDRSNEQRLRVAYFCSTVPVDDVLSAFRVRHPEIVLEFAEQRPVTRVQDAVAAGDADVGVAWWPIFRGDLHGVVTAVDPVVVALRADDPLAGAPTVEFDDVAGRPLAQPWTRAPRAWIRDRTRDWRPDGPRRDDPDVVGADEAFEAVRHARAVYPMPAGISRLYDIPGLRFVPLSGVDPYRCGVVCRRSDRTAVTLHFINAATAMLAAAGSD